MPPKSYRPLPSGRSLALTRFFPRRGCAAPSSVFYEQPRLEDLPLYIAILKQAQREIERRYGAGAFIILFWYNKQVLGADPIEQFKEAGLDVIPIDRIISDIDKNSAAYVLAEVDLHPNAVANHQIAAFLAHAVGPQHCDARDHGKNAATQQ